jgi:hypothetical protein
VTFTIAPMPAAVQSCDVSMGCTTAAKPAELLLSRTTSEWVTPPRLGRTTARTATGPVSRCRKSPR